MHLARCRYGFSSTESCEEFKQSPKAYIAAARDVLLKHPHVIPIVASTDTTIPHLLSDVLNMGYHILRLDCGTQTPTHFVESHIDPTCAHLNNLTLAWNRIHTSFLHQLPTSVAHVLSPIQLRMERVGAKKESCCAGQPTEQGDQELPDNHQDILER